MRKKFILFVLFIGLPAFAQTDKVLLVGDSWAQQQYSDDIHNAVFDVNGYTNIRILQNADATAVVIDGTTAGDWVVPSELQKITDALINNPSVDTVQLTLGGNDFLDNWNTSMTMMEVDALKNQIVADLQTIIDAILAVDINIEIVLSFYDYPNFEETVGGLVGIVCSDLYNNMMQPSTTELNTMALEFTSAFAQIASQNPKVFHVSHWGRMQNAYGSSDGSIGPGVIQLPGDVSLTSPLIAMREHDFGIFTERDCFHLTPEGYDILVQALFEEYYQYRFDTIFKSLFE